MEDYKKKYEKYKNKYNQLKNNLNIKGGIIGEIDDNKLRENKLDEEIPVIIKKYVNLITIPDTKVIRVGSAMLKIQPFYSDIDIMNIVHKQVNSDELVKFFILNLKNILNTIDDMPNVFFSDFKAGKLHWTKEQIMKEKNNEISLYEACFIKDVIKLDIIGPYDERYLEMSTFFILQSNNNYINVEENYFKSFKNSLLKDITKYKELKPFKALKRVWSLSNINNDLNTMKLLKNIIKSNIALLSLINADIETLILLLKHNNDYDKQFILNELDGFREKISTILDIKIDYEKLNLLIDIIKILFIIKDKNLNEIHYYIINFLTKLHDYILTVINKETYDYINKINFKFMVIENNNMLKT